MPLVDLWKSNPAELNEKHIQQIIAIAGEGKLLDGNSTSAEMRELLSIVHSQKLEEYAHQCLESSFDGSGLILQDIVNQIGRRLGFKVQYGRYRGKPGQGAFDGLWELGSARKIIVEVKTTDAYRINLDTLAGYRRAAVTPDSSSADDFSILLVVGRDDTGGLEAQIRGSRYAWDMRVISIDALLHLMALKQTLDDPATVSKIASVLVPQEFTKLDGIVDLVFTTAKEAEEAANPEEPNTQIHEGGKKQPKFIPVSFHDDCVKRIESHLHISLIKDSRSIYRTTDDAVRVWIANSKQFVKKAGEGYWFGFHPRQKNALEQSENAYCALGCGSALNLFLIPLSDLAKLLEKTWVSERDGRMYWHIRVECRKGKHHIALRKGFGKVDIQQYLIPS